MPHFLTDATYTPEQFERYSSFLKFVRLKWNPPAADPVNEEALSDNRKMITNQQLELYNEAAVDVLQSSKADGRPRVKLLAASRQAAMETIAQSDDGLHLPESTRNVVGRSFQMCSFAGLDCGSSVTLARLRLREPRCS